MGNFSMPQVAALAVIFLTAACTATDLTSNTDGDVAKVTVSVFPVEINNSGFGLPPDTVVVVADVRDARGRVISNGLVTWQMELVNGSPVADTIATLVPTGTRTATVRIRRSITVGVVATAVGADNVSRSGMLYLAPP
jgi:hypothetical protein